MSLKPQITVTVIGEENKMLTKQWLQYIRHHQQSMGRYHHRIVFTMPGRNTISQGNSGRVESRGFIQLGILVDEYPHMREDCITDTMPIE